MSSGGGGGVSSDINVTPMIDVLLVLLIIFMVVIALGRTAVPINIPPTDTATKNQTQSDQIVLELRDDGTYWINGTQYTADNLAAGITQIFAIRPAKLMFLKPGVNRIYADVIKAVDTARSSGVEVVGVTPIEAY
ncbi:MAG TPA: biopolymer transporter ExbD [Gemmatimonadales bacterium]|jgi:biopolymer transport protein ExbD